MLPGSTNDVSVEDNFDRSTSSCTVEDLFSNSEPERKPYGFSHGSSPPPLSPAEPTAPLHEPPPLPKSPLHELPDGGRPEEETGLDSVSSYAVSLQVLCRRLEYWGTTHQDRLDAMFDQQETMNKIIEECLRRGRDSSAAGSSRNALDKADVNPVIAYHSDETRSEARNLITVENVNGADKSPRQTENIVRHRLTAQDANLLNVMVGGRKDSNDNAHPGLSPRASTFSRRSIIQEGVENGTLSGAPSSFGDFGGRSMSRVSIAENGQLKAESEEDEESKEDEEETHQEDSDAGVFAQLKRGNTQKAFRQFRYAAFATKSIASSKGTEARPSLVKKRERLTVKKQAMTDQRTKPLNQIEGGGCLASLKRLVLSPVFDYSAGFMIVLSALCTGMQVQYEATTGPANDMFIFVFAEYWFCIVFALELALRFLALGLSMFTNSNERGWCVFDMLLVTISIIDISKVFAAVPSGATVLKLIRMARIARLLRMVRLLGELRVMVRMILHSTFSLFWLFILLICMIYVFAILITQGATEFLLEREKLTCKECYGSALEEDAMLVQQLFGSLLTTMYTLFQSMTDGMSWSTAADTIGHVGTPYFALYLFFMFFALFSVLNVVTGVFVDGAIQLANQDRALLMKKEAMQREASAQHLLELLTQIDADDNGSITLEEFETSLTQPAVANFMAALHINPLEAKELFHLLDTDASGEVEIDEFVEGMQRLRGEAKSLDIHLLRQVCKFMLRVLIEDVDHLQEQIEIIARETIGARRDAMFVPKDSTVHVPEDEHQPRANDSVSAVFKTASSLQSKGSRKSKRSTLGSNNPRLSGKQGPRKDSVFRGHGMDMIKVQRLSCSAESNMLTDLIAERKRRSSL